MLRDSQEWDGPCEVAIIVTLNKFGTLRAQDLDQQGDNACAQAGRTAS